MDKEEEELDFFEKAKLEQEEKRNKSKKGNKNQENDEKINNINENNEEINIVEEGSIPEEITENHIEENKTTQN